MKSSAEPAEKSPGALKDHLSLMPAILSFLDTYYLLKQYTTPYVLALFCHSSTIGFQFTASSESLVHTFQKSGVSERGR